VALNVGVPLNQVADVLAAAVGGEETVWQKWRRMPESTSDLMPYVLTRLVDASGPGVALSITGVDVNEMVPVPILFWSADSDGAVVDELADLVVAPDDGVGFAPVHDAARGITSLPYIGGPSLMPTVARYRGKLIASNSQPTIEHVIEQGPLPQQGPQYKGNLAVEVEPGALADMVLDIGQLFADAGAIRDFTSESFKEAAADWRDQANRFGTAVLVGTIADHAIELELVVRLSDVTPAIPEQP
jgi:hypothetical protein